MKKPLKQRQMTILFPIFTLPERIAWIPQTLFP